MILFGPGVIVVESENMNKGLLIQACILVIRIKKGISEIRITVVFVELISHLNFTRFR